MTTKELLNELQNWNEHELFYYNYYIAKNSKNFQEFLNTLDTEYLKKKMLIVPEIKDGFMPDFVTDADYFFDKNSQNNVILTKHNRYTPAFFHSHQFFELIYVLKGACRQNIAYEQIDLKEGDFCLVSPSTSHSIEVFNNSLIINILIRRGSFEDIFYNVLKDTNKVSQFFNSSLYSKKNNAYLIMESKNDNTIKEHVLSMYIEYTERKKYYENILDSSLMILFSKLLQQYENTMKLPGEVRKSSALFSDIMAYFDANYQTISLNDIARHFHFSTAYCSRLIKKHTGKSFTQLQQSIRFNKACFFLKHTNQPIAEISALVGFQNVEHFNRLFKKRYQKTPGQFRKDNN